MSSEFDLQCLEVNRHFGDFIAVDNVSFNIEKGTFFSILGPSGCGKTTLLRMIAGFDEPDSGDIKIKGRSVCGLTPNRRPVNMVFQHLALFPMMNVAENIAYGLKRRGVGRSEIEQKVKTALQKVHLPDAGEKQITQLSGGQKQRIAIARCLVLDPEVLLLDEPLGALDLKLREEMKVELKLLQQEVGTTFIYITHDQSEALVMSDQIAVMNQGKFEQVGTPQQLYYQPQSAFTANFVGNTNHWRGRTERIDSRHVLLKTDSGFEALTDLAEDSVPAVGTKVEIFIRPESIRLGNDGDDNFKPCIVDEVLFDGANTRVMLRDDQSQEKFTACLPQTGEFAGMKKGDHINVSWKASATQYFTAA